jgi:hypothetical protein
MIMDGVAAEGAPPGGKPRDWISGCLQSGGAVFFKKN